MLKINPIFEISMFFEHFRSKKGFESYLAYSFWRSLQSKETQKVHLRFCSESRKNGLRNSCVAALKPVYKLKKPENTQKTPKGRKKTQNVVVDKLRFFDGDPYGNRTHVFAVRGRCLSLLTNGPLFAER